VLKTQYILVSLLCGLTLLRWLWLSEVPQDTGDGLAHFFIAQSVWTNPLALLNHWGKPLFTLLAAPWAALGYTAFVIFNVVVYLCTLWIAFLISGQLAFKSRFMLLFPLGLLTSLDYTSNILGGMTEVLFGCMVLLSGLLILQKRWVWFALLISLAPFARSEGQLLLPLAALILAYYKQWKALPFLLVGFFVYAVLGALAFGDFWWYFTQNPYRGAEDIYGHGTWMHYFDYWYVHLGVFGLLMFLAALPVFIFDIIRRKNKERSTLLILYFSAIYFGILLTHIYLWANGKNGALGLTRLAIHGWPGLLLACIIALESRFQGIKWQTMLVGIGLAASAWIVVDYPWIAEQPFPRKAQADERAVVQAADYVKDRIGNATENHVYYYHPLVAYQLGVNLHDTTGVYKQKKFYPFHEIYQNLKNGDLIILDPHFAHRDMSFPKESISLFEELMIFTPMNQYVPLETTPSQVLVLRVNKSKRDAPAIFEKNSLLDKEISISPTDLYTNLIELEARDFSSAFIKFDMELNVLNLPDDLLYFVVQDAASGESITFELGQNNSLEFSLSFTKNQIYKMFVHNPKGLAVEFQAKVGYSPR